LRWGILDVDGWLATVDPRTIDRWLMFARIEPEHFAVSAPRKSESAGGGELKDGRDAVRSLMARVGGK
jgi:hypothetical protein